MAMPTVVPKEATPVTAGRQGTRSRAGSDAVARELAGSPLSSRPGRDETG
jgi:hypothetical protein